MILNVMGPPSLSFPVYDLVCLERDAEAESESLLSLGVLRGGESERSTAPGKR